MYEYYVVCGAGLKDLEKQVSKRLNSGWQLTGGVVLEPGNVYMQSMFRKS